MSTIVTRSGKGSPLTHAEVDSNFTNLNTDKLELSGGTLTGTLNFGDNVKAQFGASADLQVYHDGSNSYIQDAGAGSLIVTAADQMVIQKGDGTNRVADFHTTNGTATLKYQGNSVLATTATGIDVTGTVVADGATFDGEVSVGLTQGDISLENLDNQSSSTDAGIILNGGGTIRSGMFTEVDGEILSYAINMPQIDASYDQTRSGGNFRLDTRSTENVFVVKRRAENSTSIFSAIEIDLNEGDLSLYNTAGSTEFFWDASAERLGIGTTIPRAGIDINANGSGGTVGLHVNKDDTAGYFVRFEADLGTNNNRTLTLSTPETDSASEPFIWNTGNSHAFETDGTQRLQIKDQGIQVTGSVEINGWTITESGGSLYFATGGTNKMKLDASGNLDVVGSVNSNATIT